MVMTRNVDDGFKNSERLLYLVKEGVKDAKPAAGVMPNLVKTLLVQQ